MGTSALIALISTLVPVANDLIGFIFTAQATLKKDKEMTPQEEEALDAAIKKLTVNPEEWQKVQPL